MQAYVRQSARRGLCAVLPKKLKQILNIRTIGARRSKRTYGEKQIGSTHAFTELLCVQVEIPHVTNINALKTGGQKRNQSVSVAFLKNNQRPSVVTVGFYLRNSVVPAPKRTKISPRVAGNEQVALIAVLKRGIVICGFKRLIVWGYIQSKGFGISVQNGTF